MGKVLYIEYACELTDLMLKEDITSIKVHGDGFVKEFVQIIRCKDCKYYIEKELNCFAKEQGYCGYTWKEHDKDWFCARGRKREEQNDEID